MQHASIAEPSQRHKPNFVFKINGSQSTNEIELALFFKNRHIKGLNYLPAGFVKTCQRVRWTRKRLCKDLNSMAYHNTMPNSY